MKFQIDTRILHVGETGARPAARASPAGKAECTFKRVFVDLCPSSLLVYAEVFHNTHHNLASTIDPFHPMDSTPCKLYPERTFFVAQMG